LEHQAIASILEVRQATHTAQEAQALRQLVSLQIGGQGSSGPVMGNYQ
jgi:hypothetical protein